MKRLLPVLGLCFFVIFGVFLLFQMAMPPIPVGWKIVSEKGTLHWNPQMKKITLYQHSDNLVIDQGADAIGDFTNFTVVKDKPNATTLLRIMTGKPTLLQGKLESDGRLHIINPNGVIVGRNAEFNFTAPVSSGVGIEPDVRELKAFGNVYALAINREGAIHAARSGGSVRIASPKASREAPFTADKKE